MTAFTRMRACFSLVFFFIVSRLVLLLPEFGDELKNYLLGGHQLDGRSPRFRIGNALLLIYLQARSR
jgi:hypothetical protein